jgi:hypothetical protein
MSRLDIILPAAEPSDSPWPRNCFYIARVGAALKSGLGEGSRPSCLSLASFARLICNISDKSSGLPIISSSKYQTPPYLPAFKTAYLENPRS